MRHSNRFNLFSEKSNRNVTRLANYFSPTEASVRALAKKQEEESATTYLRKIASLTGMRSEHISPRTTPVPEGITPKKSPDKRVSFFQSSVFSYEGDAAEPKGRTNRNRTVPEGTPVEPIPTIKW